jgi:hypothetical protein
MNTEPPTGDDLQRMLVSMKQNVLERAIDQPRRRAHRTLGIVIGLVALITVGSASGALALGVLPAPFAAKAPSAPTSTPAPVVTPTTAPTPTPTPTTPSVEVDTAPTSTVPISCDALGTAIGVSTLIPGTVSASSGVFSADDAARLQKGVLSCLWSGTPNGPLLSMDIDTDTTAARSWITSRLASGNVPIGVDTASAAGCQTLSTGCDLSMVGSRYWVEATYEGSQDSTSTIASTLAPMARKVVSTLSGLTPLAAWQGPSTSWSTVTECQALGTTKPMSDVLSSPGMTGPGAVNPGSKNGIERTAGALGCLWSVPDGQAPAGGAPDRIDVDVVPGGAWAYALYTDDAATVGTSVPVTVGGADAARLDCGLAENQTCSLDILTDHSWMQIGLGDSFVAADQAKLVAAAEAVLGAHR